MKNATDSIAVIIVAGGSGARMGARLPKQFLPLDGRPVLMHTVQRFADALPQSRIVVVLPSSHIEYWDKLCRRHGFAVPHIVCTGGANRFESVSNGLRHAGEAELIAAGIPAFRLYFAAQEVTGIKRLWEEFPYEDACGRFEEADGHELLRYLTAAYFKAVAWEIVPGTTYEKAVLGDIDTGTPQYRDFESQVYMEALRDMDVQALLPDEQQKDKQKEHGRDEHDHPHRKGGGAR